MENIEQIQRINKNNKKYSISTGISIIIMIIGILIDIVIFNWLRNIRNCSCSKIKSYNKYLSYVSAFLIVWRLILLLSFIIHETNPNDYNPIINIINIFIPIIVLVYYIFLFKYVINLKDIKCDCGNLIIENFVFYYSLIGISILLIVFTILLISILFSSSTT
jgi:hypothetical protein